MVEDSEGVEAAQRAEAQAVRQRTEVENGGVPRMRCFHEVYVAFWDEDHGVESVAMMGLLSWRTPVGLICVISSIPCRNIWFQHPDAKLYGEASAYTLQRPPSCPYSPDFSQLMVCYLIEALTTALIVDDLSVESQYMALAPPPTWVDYLQRVVPTAAAAEYWISMSYMFPSVVQ